MSIQNKFLLPCMATLLVAFALMGGVSAWRVYSAISSSTEEQLTQNTSILAHSAETWAQDRQRDVHNWAEYDALGKSLDDSFVAKASRKMAENYFGRLVSGYDFLTAVTLLNSVGEPAVMVARDGATFDAARAHAALVKAGPEAVADGVSLTWADAGLLVVARAITDEKSGATGVLVANFDIGELVRKVFDTVSVGTSGKAVLTASDGTPVVPGSISAERAEALLGASSVAAVELREAADTSLVTARRPVGETGWVAWSTIDASEFSSEAVAVGTQLAALAVIVLLILAGIIVALLRMIIQPIRMSTAVMTELANGNTAVEILAADRKDEVGEMASAVRVFRDAALEQERLEADAKANREREEAEQADRAAADRAKAQELTAFVSDIEAGFDRLANGDLTVRLERPVASDYEAIRTQFNRSITMLEDALGAVVGSVASIRNGLSEITTASTELSQRTEQQAANLEQTVAALGEVTSGVNETAAGAAQAQTSARTAQQKAEKGGKIVSQAVAAITQIEKSSEEIGKIIGVIDEIAFQTNLLALNAGVEAARAGEAGSGFAVVAQEVRGLAQRSAEAAKEIKNLISISRGQVGEGVELVTASGTSLEEIVAQVAEMNQVIAKIAQSASEQANSLKEVSVAADQMDKVTQQNAAMVEQATAAAQALSNETGELADMAARFKTAGSAGHSSHGMAGTRGQMQTPLPGATESRRTVTQLKTAGAGGAVARPAANADDWEEF